MPLAWWHAGRPRKPILILPGGLLTALGAGIHLLQQPALTAARFKIHSFEEIDPQRHTWLDYLRGGFGRSGIRPFRLRAGSAPIWMLFCTAVAVGPPQPSPPASRRAGPPYLLIVVPRIRVVRRLVSAFPLRADLAAALAIALVPLLARRGQTAGHC